MAERLAFTLDLIIQELRRAQTKHPRWPEKDLLRQVAIVQEEAGEAQKEALTIIERAEVCAETGNDGADIAEIEAHEKALDKEMIQTAAMALRFLLNRNLDHLGGVL